MVTEYTCGKVIRSKVKFCLSIGLDANKCIFFKSHASTYINVKRKKDGERGRDRVTTIDYFITLHY